MFTISYWDDTEATWIGHRRFTNLTTAIGQAGPHDIVTDLGGRVVHGDTIAQRCPRAFR